MTLHEAMSELESLGNDAMRKMNAKNGAPENQFGVKMGDIRGIAKKIKADHDLALQLWETGNADARLLALLVIKPKRGGDDILVPNHPEYVIAIEPEAGRLVLRLPVYE